MHTRLITAEDTIPLRQALLRPGRPVEESIYAGDHDATSFHVGAFENDNPDGMAVGIATMLLADDPRCEAAPAFRLRGMAVAASHQKTGYGSAALQFAEAEAGRRGGVIVWCNAREIAVPFYRRNGYETVGDVFSLPNIGPHFFCRKRLADQSLSQKENGHRS